MHRQFACFVDSIAYAKNKYTFFAPSPCRATRLIENSSNVFHHVENITEWEKNRYQKHSALFFAAGVDGRRFVYTGIFFLYIKKLFKKNANGICLESFIFSVDDVIFERFFGLKK